MAQQNCYQPIFAQEDPTNMIHCSICMTATFDSSATGARAPLVGVCGHTFCRQCLLDMGRSRNCDRLPCKYMFSFLLMCYSHCRRKTWLLHLSLPGPQCNQGNAFNLNYQRVNFALCNMIEFCRAVEEERLRNHPTQETVSIFKAFPEDGRTVIVEGEAQVDFMEGDTPLFHVRYNDDDSEHISADELRQLIRESRPPE